MCLYSLFKKNRKRQNCQVNFVSRLIASVYRILCVKIDASEHENFSDVKTFSCIAKSGILGSFTSVNWFIYQQ